jgi:hypothetical protein
MVFTIVWGPDTDGKVVVVDDDGKIAQVDRPCCWWMPYEKPLKKTLYFSIYTHEDALLVKGPFTTLKAARPMASHKNYIKTVEVEFTNTSERKRT